MGYSSSRSSTETSLSILRRSKPIKAAWWSFVTKCGDIVASHGTPPPNQAIERTDLSNPALAHGDSIGPNLSRQLARREAVAHSVRVRHSSAADFYLWRAAMQPTPGPA